MFAPSQSLHVRFPESFGRRVAIFVDTEEEFDWTRARRRDETSVMAIKALPVAHRVLRGFDLTPTYLIDYPVASTGRSIEILRRFLEADECTIGAQLHAWVNPPHTENLEPATSFAGNLAKSLEYAKLDALTQAIRVGFDVQPTFYRAGRYGVGPNSEAVLDMLGYRVDTSVRPLFDYSSEDGPSFMHEPAIPYWTGKERRLLEVPLTTTFVGHLRSVGKPLYRHSGRRLRSALARTGLLNRVPLTPEGIPVSEALEALRVLLDTDTRLINISFHSPSVEPGHTPYVRDAADLKRFYGWFDSIFGFLAKRGVMPVSSNEILEAADATR